MKIITAMVQPFMLSKVTQALEEIEGFPGMTITKARGFGRRITEPEQHALIFGDFKEKARIEIVARDEMVDQIVETLVRAAHTGNDGDGKVFVWPVECAIRIQTGETDDAAI
ncbi:MAG: P-II family nitrogen regulator [Acidobacteriota bacterium]